MYIVLFFQKTFFGGCNLRPTVPSSYGNFFFSNGMAVKQMSRTKKLKKKEGIETEASQRYHEYESTQIRSHNDQGQPSHFPDRETTHWQDVSYDGIVVLDEARRLRRRFLSHGRHPRSVSYFFA